MKRRVRGPTQQERLTALFRTFTFLTTPQIARALGVTIPQARVLLSAARKAGTVHTRHHSAVHAYRSHRVTPLEVSTC